LVLPCVSNEWVSENEVPMQSNRSVPDATVIPVLVYPDVRQAVAWLTTAFGFAERVRIGEDHRSQLRFGDGARIRMEPTDFEYGERQYEAEDPFGHQWTFTETLSDVAPEEWGGETEAP
jgi:uncharacterized glyoxalase superfamily protein PhnB